MFSAYARAALALLVAPFLAFILGQILPQFVGVMQGGPGGGQTSRVVELFQALTGPRLLLVMLLSVFVFVLGRAVVERRLGGGV